MFNTLAGLGGRQGGGGLSKLDSPACLMTFKCEVVLGQPNRTEVGCHLKVTLELCNPTLHLQGA